MGYELLKALVLLLRGEGISAGEAYPGTGAPAVDGPQAAVGLLELDVPAGLAKFQVRVLSPRHLGGWGCQVWAARVSEALSRAGMTCEAEEMEYLDGLDCFCVTVLAEQSSGSCGGATAPFPGCGCRSSAAMWSRSGWSPSRRSATRAAGWWGPSARARRWASLPVTEAGSWS